MRKKATPFFPKTHQKCQRTHMRSSGIILKLPERIETFLGYVLYLLAIYINQTPTYDFFSWCFLQYQ